jgi:hypothetical protein
MKTLLEKEIRLLLPAFAGALVLAILPAWLLPYDSWNPKDYSVYFFWFGVVLLSLSSLGREVGLKTLSFMLAQPLPRARIWWIKAAVLATFVALAFDAWWLTVELTSIFRPIAPQHLAMAGIFVVVFTTGGLWMTLLLRQVTAALLLTIMIPGVVFMAITALGGTDWIIFTIFGFYAVAAFALAWRQFLHLQDSAWTGGVVTLGGTRSADDVSTRTRTPWAALFRKELQLHQFTLAGIAGIFVLHLAAVMLRKIGAHSFGKNTLLLLQVFGWVWVFVPVLAGSESVAEERQIGMFDTLLSMPISRRLQFVFKLGMVVLLGGILSAALLCCVEWIGNSIGAGAHLDVMGVAFKWVNVAPIFIAFSAIAALSFFASTLTRSVVQALAVAVSTVVVIAVICDIGRRYGQIFGWKLWPTIAYPLLSITILWLSYGNFKWMFESGRRWRRNIFALLAVNVLIFSSSAAIYHRVWEFAMPLEDQHGPARIAKGVPLQFGGFRGDGLSLILPDGRLWVARWNFDFGRLQWTEFAPGSNWMDATVLHFESVGIQSNGTLWLSDNPGKPFTQFGAEANWQSLVPYSASSVFLLKRDGTLWFWGTNTLNVRHYPGLRSFTPRRCGGDSDWAKILRGEQSVFAWKQNGDAWDLHERGEQYNWGDRRFPFPFLNHQQFLTLNTAPGSPLEVGILFDGSIYSWECFGEIWGVRDRQHPRRLTQDINEDLIASVLWKIGMNAKWKAISIAFRQTLAVKNDNTLWRLKLPEHHQNFSLTEEIQQTVPVRFGTNDDWITVGWVNEPVALSADGTLWRWPTSSRWNWYDADQWLGPSSRPAKLANIFDAPQL